MRRLVLDTNVYIDWLNAGEHEAIVFQSGTVKFLSAVVMMELFAGALSHSLADDVLIALSARSIGATVITQNKRDFLAIQAIRAFRHTLVS